MAMAKCAWCDGKGIDNVKLNSPCNVCGGDGFIEVPDAPTPCGRCNGTGKSSESFHGEIQKCSGCRGSGWAS